MAWTTWKRYTRENIAKLPNRRGEYEAARRHKPASDFIDQV